MSRVKAALANTRFGRLMANREIGKNSRKYIIWECICDCGSITSVTSSDLLGGNTKSCGCLQKERASQTSKLNLTGKRFGRLIAIRESGRTSRGRIIWECHCDCGKIVYIQSTYLTIGDTKSCGCLSVDTLVARVTKHGLYRAPIYKVWKTMIQRCTNTHSHDWPNYGGRGISVCERWKIFKNFYDDMGDRPTGMTIERVNNNKGYEPNNCRWATQVEQSHNKRDNVWIIHNGKRLILSDWARETGIPHQILSARLARGDQPPRLLRPIEHVKLQGSKS